MPNLAGMVDDGISHAPPTTGGFPYNTFLPAAPIGSTYIDPVFGATVRRVSTDSLDDNIYTSNMWWNADETRFSHNATIINVATNTVEYTGVPVGSFNYEVGFDPVDPDVYYYYSNTTTTQLRKITLQGGGTWADTLFFTAPSALLGLGGTLNWWDASGRYFLVRYGSEPSVRLYDKQNIGAGAYANPLDGTIIDANFFIGITPDAQYLVGFQANGLGGSGGVQTGLSWAINHGARSVAATATQFWSIGGAHAAFISASDGRNYCVLPDQYDAAEMWAVDITNSVVGLTTAVQEKALPNNKLLLALTFNDGVHVTTVARGALKDWAFIATEDTSDLFNGGVSPWRAYKQELIAMNVVTGEVRRLAHHRSRSIGADYFHQPHPSASWKGKYLGFASNFNVNVANNVDIFAVQFDLGGNGGLTKGGILLPVR